MEDTTRITPPPPPPTEFEPGTAPAQPEAVSPLKKSMPLIVFLCVVLGLIGLVNFLRFVGGADKAAQKSNLAMQPASSSAQQVTNYQAQQSQLAKQDQAEEQRLKQLQAQFEEFKHEQDVPGPESPNAQPMTPAQRDAMYGANNPNAPKKTSAVTQAQAEAKQRALAREKQHQDALNSNTVAIDFAHTETATATPTGAALSRRSSAPMMTPTSEDADGQPQLPSNRAAGTHQAAQQGDPSMLREAAEQQPGQQTARKDPMAAYDFDRYDGRIYRVFEGTVFEGVVTNHIDGGLAGPILIMLTTDYYSHDHQQLLLPQGTRLIGNVQSVGGAQQRKLLVVFNRAICPDGFSIDLNKFAGLDPLGTTGLASSVNNHYLSSFAAAAAVGGLGGLAQIGNSGSVLDSSTQLRNGMTSQTSQEGMLILERFLNRLPVITVKEGSRARVYINRDILIPSYAEHRVDPVL